MRRSQRVWTQYPNDGDRTVRAFLPGKTYTALVYEYVEEGANDPAVVRGVAGFLWLAGFSFASSPLARNWKSGMLVDLSDIVQPRGYGWCELYYGLTEIKEILRE